MAGKAGQGRAGQGGSVQGRAGQRSAGRRAGQVAVAKAFGSLSSLGPQTPLSILCLQVTLMPPRGHFGLSACFCCVVFCCFCASCWDVAGHVARSFVPSGEEGAQLGTG